MQRSVDESFSAAWLLLASGSSLVAIAAVLLSFRVPFPAIDIALHANASRMLAAAAAGMSFAAAAVLRGGSGRALREAYIFALSIGAAGGIAVGLKFVGGTFAGCVFGGVGAVVAMGLVRLFDGRHRGLNLGLALVLMGLFGAGIVAYLAVSTEHLGMGSVGLWLLGDVSRAHGTGAVLVFALVVIGIGWAARSTGERGSETAAILLVGLGVGVAGPVAFIGWAAASLAQLAGGTSVSESKRLVLAAIVGGALMMLADAVARLLVGGYAPPLNLTIGFVAIPAFLWWNRRRLRCAARVPGGWVFAGFEALVLLLLAAGLLMFADAFTNFVRMST